MADRFDICSATKDASNPCPSKRGEHVMGERTGGGTVGRNRRDTAPGPGLGHHDESGATVASLRLFTSNRNSVHVRGNTSMGRSVAGRNSWMYIRSRRGRSGTAANAYGTLAAQSHGYVPQSSTCRLTSQPCGSASRTWSGTWA